ncbi:MAG: serine/threonine protein kinase [Polyangiaceae bacterium]|nr:serine/threonine protein kinase [Polyangiaceae bacterium]
MSDGDRDLGDVGYTDGIDCMPSVIGKYRLLAELGRGGMAKVFLAVASGPSGFSKLVVLKTIRIHLVDDPDTLQMFLDEARIAGRLNHANVVDTLEVAKIDGHHIMVMEYLDGQSFATILRRTKKNNVDLPLSFSLRCVADSLQGLHYAHELKDFDGTPMALVHRDVSPQNIFVTYDGQVKILDFGIAKATTSSSETKAGVIKGKIAYMAPEQFLGEMTDRRIDIYAMGAVLWQVATGHRLWRGMVDGQVIHRVIAGDIPDPSTVNRDVDPRLARITMKALARHRDERYPTCTALLNDIEKLIALLGPPISSREIGALVSELFADERREITSVVERQLSKAQNCNTQEFKQTYLPAIHPITKGHAIVSTDSTGQMVISTHSSRVGNLLSGSNSGLYGASTNSGAATAHSIPDGIIHKPAARRPWALIAGAAAIGVAGIVAWQVASKREEQPATATGTPTESAAPQPATNETDSQILIEIKAEPSSARIFIDEIEKLGNPVSHRVPKDGKPHKIRIQAAGHETREVEILADNDVSATIALEKSQSPDAPTHTTVGRAPRQHNPNKTEPTETTPPPPPPPPTTTTPPKSTAKPPPNAKDRIQTLDTSSPW